MACTEPGDVADSVMMGSHIDTVATGGRYDGNLGVLAGLEVIESVLASGHMPARSLSVAYFTDEEGSRFAPDMLGSLAYVGGMALEEALEITDRDGMSVGEELDRIGYRGSAPVPGTVPYAYMELHIEQGPVLEFHGIQIGVVEGVQGISWTEVTLRGAVQPRRHHADAPLRRDAGLAACRIAGEVREMAHNIGDSQVGTVGSISLVPNLVKRHCGFSHDDGGPPQHLRRHAAARRGPSRRDRCPHCRRRASRRRHGAHGTVRGRWSSIRPSSTSSRDALPSRT